MCDLTESWEIHALSTPAPIWRDEEIELLFKFYERFDFQHRFLFDCYASDPNGCWIKYAHERWGTNDKATS